MRWAQWGEDAAANRRAAERVAAALGAGGLAILPTETVYGLAADATAPAAVAALYAAKGRPAFNPLIAHVADLAAADRVADLPPTAQALAERFWPGPLTLVAPRRKAGPVCDLAVAGLATVAVRAPAHPAAQAVLAALGRPLAMPSANLSGRLSAAVFAPAAEALGAAAAAGIDAGPCPVGLESTILAVPEGGPAQLLRPGGLSVELLEEALGAPILDPGASAASAAPLAPGQLDSHYAPAARLRLGAAYAEKGEAWLGFGPSGGPRQSGPLARNLSPSGDDREAAARLYEDLRALDQALLDQALLDQALPDQALPTAGAQPAVIAVAPIPPGGLGRAIRDRLRRAAAPRPGS